MAGELGNIFYAAISPYETAIPDIQRAFRQTPTSYPVRFSAIPALLFPFLFFSDFSFNLSPLSVPTSFLSPTSFPCLQPSPISPGTMDIYLFLHELFFPRFLISILATYTPCPCVRTSVPCTPRNLKPEKKSRFSLPVLS